MKAGTTKYDGMTARFRKKHHLSAPQLASWLGVSAITIYRWENGTCPAPAYLEHALRSWPGSAVPMPAGTGGGSCGGGSPLKDRDDRERRKKAAPVELRPCDDERHPALFPEHLRPPHRESTTRPR